MLHCHATAPRPIRYRVMAQMKLETPALVVPACFRPARLNRKCAGPARCHCVPLLDFGPPPAKHPELARDRAVAARAADHSPHRARRTRDTLPEPCALTRDSLSCAPADAVAR